MVHLRLGSNRGGGSTLKHQYCVLIVCHIVGYLHSVPCAAVWLWLIVCVKFCKPVSPSLSDNGSSLFAILVLGGYSFKKVLDLRRKLKQNWGTIYNGPFFTTLWYLDIYMY